MPPDDVLLRSGVSAAEIDFGQGDTLTFVNVASNDLLVKPESIQIWFWDGAFKVAN